MDLIREVGSDGHYLPGELPAISESIILTRFPAKMESWINNEKM
jgi:hypothetical protein